MQEDSLCRTDSYVHVGFDGHNKSSECTDSWGMRVYGTQVLWSPSPTRTID